MDELTQQESTTATKGCVNCGHPIVVEGYPNPLCSDCRQSLIKYPIPVYIKIFAVLIVLVMIYSLTKLPHNLMAVVHYERGLKAAGLNDYATASREFKSTLSKEPDFVKAKFQLLISAAEELDYATVFELSNELKGQEVEDAALLSRMNQAVEGIARHFPADSLMNIAGKYGSLDSIPVKVYRDYITAFPDEVFPRVRLSTILWEKKEYAVSDSLLNDVLWLDRTLKNGYAIKASVKRVMKQYDSALWYCDQILRMNRQSILGMASKARVLLHMNKNKEGLGLALQCRELNNKDPFGMATLALAYHFNHDLPARDQLVKAASADSTMVPYFKYVQDIINGMEKFRD